MLGHSVCVCVCVFFQRTNEPISTFMIQIAVLANHQNGRDTHMRQIKVYTPVEESSIGKFPRCTTVDFMMYRTIRWSGRDPGTPTDLYLELQQIIINERNISEASSVEYLKMFSQSHRPSQCWFTCFNNEFPHRVNALIWIWFPYLTFLSLAV